MVCSPTCSSTLIDVLLDSTGILMLNICLLIPILTSVVNGFNSSLLNSLSSPQFQIRHVLSACHKDHRLANFTSMARSLCSSSRNDLRQAMSMMFKKILKTTIRHSQFYASHWKLDSSAYRLWHLSPLICMAVEGLCFLEVLSCWLVWDYKLLLGIFPCSLVPNFAVSIPMFKLLIDMVHHIY